MQIAPMVSRLVRRSSKDKPWTQYPAHTIPQPPSMLGDEERQFLYYLGKDVYDGVGEIVDAGAFLGGSASALGAGLSDNTQVANKTGRIFSYDFFEYASYYEGYIPEFKLKDGDDTLPVFHRFTADYAESIVPVKGDICQQRWNGRPIDILFVDFTQNWDHHAFVVRNFYRHMVPGKSVLVHQDYLFTVCYWLHIFMEHYEDCFELISPEIMNSSTAWVLKQELPADVYDRQLNERLSFDEQLSYLDRSIEKYDGTKEGLLKCARGRFLFHTGRQAQAIEYAESLASHYRRDSLLLPHVTILVNELQRLTAAAKR